MRGKGTAGGSSAPYDIYDRRLVDALKRDYAELWGRYEEVVHENALLEARLDRYRRSVDRECEWMNEL